MKLRAYYDDATDEKIGKATLTHNEPDPKDAQDGAQQQFKDDVDINVLVKRFGIHDGSITPMAMDPSYFGDFTEVTDLQGVYDLQHRSQQMFDQLPAELRARFDHNPRKLLEYVWNEKNHDEAVELGLLHREATRPSSKSSGTSTTESSTTTPTSSSAPAPSNGSGGQQ